MGVGGWLIKKTRPPLAFSFLPPGEHAVASLGGEVLWHEKLKLYDDDTMLDSMLDVVPLFCASILGRHTLIVYTFCREGCEGEPGVAYEAPLGPTVIPAYLEVFF